MNGEDDAATDDDTTNTNTNPNYVPQYGKYEKKDFIQFIVYFIYLFFSSSGYFILFCCYAIKKKGKEFSYKKRSNGKKKNFIMGKKKSNAYTSQKQLPTTIKYTHLIVFFL